MTAEPDEFAIPEHLNIGDPTTGRPRLMRTQCGTCIFRRNNGIYSPDSTARLAARACAEDSYIVCHGTYEHGQPPPHAICRGFWDRHRDDTLPLRLMRYLDAVDEVDGP